MILVDSGLIALNYIIYTVANLTGIPEKAIWKNGHFYFPRPVSVLDFVKKKKCSLFSAVLSRTRNGKDMRLFTFTFTYV